MGFVELKGPVNYTDIDPRAARDLVVREAQNIAQKWLSVSDFVEEASYSTRISSIENSTGCIRKLGQKSKFGSDGEDFGIENAKDICLNQCSIVNYKRILSKVPARFCDSPELHARLSIFLYRAPETLSQHFGEWEEMRHA